MASTILNLWPARAFFSRSFESVFTSLNIEIMKNFIGRINIFYCLTKITSLSAAIGKQFIMFEKHFPSPISAEDFFGETATISAFMFDVSLFSLESISTSRLELSSDDCDVEVEVEVDSSDESASVMFSRSLLSQSYICTGKISSC